MHGNSWTERRALLLKVADQLTDWGCATLPGDRHVGRVCFGRKYGFPPGLYPVASSEYAMMRTSVGSFQKAQTRRLPK